MYLKRLLLFILSLTLLLPASSGLGEEAPAKAENYSDMCIFTSGDITDFSAITDEKPDTHLTLAENSFLGIEWDGQVPVRTLCLWFDDKPDDYAIEQYDTAGGLTRQEQVTNGFLLSTVQLSGDTVRVVVKNSREMNIVQCRLFGEGTLDKSWLSWEPTPQKLDYLVVSAHPDDEVSLMGSVMPNLNSLGLAGSVCYITMPNSGRAVEALNCLRVMGFNTYPIFAMFPDISDDSDAEVKAGFKKEDVVLYLVRLYRERRPELVFSHDYDGENGHWQHIITAEAVVQAVKLAADPSYDAESFARHGAWQVKKCYLHLYPIYKLTFDTRTPLEAYNGMNALHTAQLARKEYISGGEAGLSVKDQGKLSIAEFGLAACSVECGEKSLFEGLELSKPVESEQNKEYFEKHRFRRDFSAPSTSDSYYSSEERFSCDIEGGYWEYQNDSLGIFIERFETATTAEYGRVFPQVYYVAHILMRNYDSYRSGFSDKEKSSTILMPPWVIARRSKAVLAITGDNLVQQENSSKGAIIRDGRIYNYYNAEAVMALWDNMTMSVYERGEKTAAQLHEMGVRETYSFGPWLIKDGRANPKAKNFRVSFANARSGLGMVEPGHFVAIVSDGRQPYYSNGFTLTQYTELFVQEGCVLAYNLDGGCSAGIVFMGEHLNYHEGNEDSTDFQRSWPDALMWGYSLLVPDETDPLYNNGNFSWKGANP